MKPLYKIRMWEFTPIVGTVCYFFRTYIEMDSTKKAELYQSKVDARVGALMLTSLALTPLIKKGLETLLPL